VVFFIVTRNVQSILWSVRILGHVSSFCHTFMKIILCAQRRLHIANQSEQRRVQ
jgi:hypothetical protein